MELFVSDTCSEDWRTSDTKLKEQIKRSRSEHSARLKSSAAMEEEYLTLENECSSSQSWPTVAAHEARLGYQDRTRGKKGTQKSLTTIVVDHERATQADPANDNTSGKNRESSEDNWPTPRAGNPGSRKPGTGGKILAEEAKKNEENWPTPTIAEVSGGMRLDQIKTGKWNNIQLREKIALMEEAKKNTWATPQASDHIEGARTAPTSNQKCLGRDMRNLTCPKPTQAKLNPNWVEQLMGLPLGWTQL
jgi:hypothetical protein